MRPPREADSSIYCTICLRRVYLKTTNTRLVLSPCLSLRYSLRASSFPPTFKFFFLWFHPGLGQSEINNYHFIIPTKLALKRRNSIYRDTVGQIIPQGGFCAINENNFTLPILRFYFFFEMDCRICMVGVSTLRYTRSYQGTLFTRGAFVFQLYFYFSVYHTFYSVE